MDSDKREHDKPVERAFGRLLRRWRNERGLSQEALADLSGCDRSYLSRLERGVNAPGLAVMIEIGKALGLSPSELLNAVGGEIERALREEPKAG